MSASRTTPHKTAILAIILVSYVMIVLDTSIVLTGLPSIHRDLGFTDNGLAWVQSAYTLTFGGFLLLAARAGDIVGRRRMLVLGLAVFTLASLVIGMAPTPAWMVGARAVQGLGAAILARGLFYQPADRSRHDLGRAALYTGKPAQHRPLRCAGGHHVHRRHDRAGVWPDPLGQCGLVGRHHPGRGGGRRAVADCFRIQ